MKNMFSDYSGVKLEIDNGIYLGNLPNIWKLNLQLHLKIHMVKEIIRENRKYFELKENDITILLQIRICEMSLKQCWGKCMILNADNREEKRSKINDWSFYLDNLEKEEQIKPKVNRKKKIIKRNQ